MPVEKQQTVKPSLFLTLLLGTLSAFGPLSLDMYLPALPQLQASFHTSSAAVQASISACLIGMAVGQLIIGPWSDRVGRRKPLLIGLVVFTLTSAALIFVHNIVVFLVLRCYSRPCWCSWSGAIASSSQRSFLRAPINYFLRHVNVHQRNFPSYRSHFRSCSSKFLPVGISICNINNCWHLTRHCQCLRSARDSY